MQSIPDLSTGYIAKKAIRKRIMPLSNCSPINLEIWMKNTFTRHPHISFKLHIVHYFLFYQLYRKKQ
jgi:hypothetical protein